MNLTTYLQNDPDNLGLAPLISAGDDGAIAVLINTQGRSKLGTIDTDVFMAWAAGNGMRAAIEDEATDKTSPVRSSALALLDLLRGSKSSGLSIANPANLAMLAGWVQLGKLSPSDRDVLITLGTHPCSYGDAAGFGNVSTQQIAEARG